eukprot:m.145234 g.145234  ORF g.145234 m.145234 type:complete len:192 (+) comp14138_c1_seq6:2238-2813(+)
MVAALFTLTVTLRDYLATPFSNDPDVIKVVAHIAIPVASGFSLWILATVCMSALEAMSRMRAILILALVCSYAITLPVGWALALPADWGVAGLMTGAAIGDAIKFMVGLILIWKGQGWQAMSEHAVHMSDLAALYLDDANDALSIDSDFEDDGENTKLLNEILGERVPINSTSSSPRHAPSSYGSFSSNDS